MPAPKLKNLFKKLGRSDRIALGLCGAAFFLWVFLLSNKYFNFGYYDWDLAFFNQATWNLLHGSTHVSLFGVNFFANHSNFIAYLLLPVYAVFSHALTLVFLKVLSYAIAGYVLYILAKEKTGAATAIALTLLYFLYPANVFGIIYEFDFESLAPAFLILMFYFFQKKSFYGFATMALVTILIKENLPLIVAAFGIFALFTKNRNRWLWGGIPIIVGFAAFYVLTTFVIPYFRGEEGHGYLGYYSGLGSSPLEIILSIILQPWKIIPYVLNPTNQKFLFELLAPVAFLPILGPHILFLGCPVLIQHLLSGAPQEHTIYYQYALSLAPFIFLASAYGLSFLKRSLRPSFYKIIIFFLILLSFFSLVRYLPWFAARLNFRADHLNSVRWQMVKSIPPDAPAMASFDFLAELSTRRQLYAFHKVYDFRHRDHFKLPEEVGVAVVDLQDRWLTEAYWLEPLETARYLQKFFGEDWTVEQAVENIILFRKAKGEKIVEIDRLPANIRYNDIQKIGNDLALNQTAVIPETIRAGETLPLIFEWLVFEDQVGHFMSQIIIAKGERTVSRRSHLNGYKIFPSFTWKKGDLVRERYWLSIPRIPPGTYEIRLRFIDLTEKKEEVTLNLTTLTIR